MQALQYDPTQPLPQRSKMRNTSALPGDEIISRMRNSRNLSAQQPPCELIMSACTEAESGSDFRRKVIQMASDPCRSSIPSV